MITIIYLFITIKILLEDFYLNFKESY